MPIDVFPSCLVMMPLLKRNKGLASLIDFTGSEIVESQGAPDTPACSKYGYNASMPMCQRVG